MLRSLAPVLASFVLASFVLVSGCDGDGNEAEAVQVLAGKSSDDLYVALVSNDRDMVLYACDGTADMVTMTQWFEGPHDDGHFELDSTRSDARAVGDFEADAGHGSILIDDLGFSFELEPAEGDAGLYFDELVDGDTTHWGGWIVLPDGSVRGSVLNRKTGDIVPAGAATPGGQLTVGALAFDVVRLRTPVL